MRNAKQETNYVHLALEKKASANFRIHRIIHSTLSATNLYGICRLSYAILGSQYLRCSVCQNCLRFHNWAAEFHWRKYNNHVDWCYQQFMVSKLSKPLSNSIFCWSALSATSHSSSSKFQLWFQGTYTVTYLLQAFISEFGFKEQSIRGNQSLHSFNSSYPQILQMFDQHPPSILRARGYLSPLLKVNFS